MPVPITTTLAGVQVAARASGPQAPEPASVQCASVSAQGAVASAVAPVEIGGPGGPEPTRYGDWERRGRCIDF